MRLSERSDNYAKYLQVKCPWDSTINSIQKSLVSSARAAVVEYKGVKSGLRRKKRKQEKRN